MRKFLKLIPATVLILVLSVAVVACGTSTSGSGATSTTSGGGTVKGGSQYGGTDFLADVVAQKVNVTADASMALKWDRGAYTATAGDVTFVVKNPSPIEHQFTVEGNGISYSSPTLKAGQTLNLTIKGLKAGEYKILCEIAGHTEAGMVAKLTVK
jgi:uncharacterized cupredoxin-like copper-binding protein